MGKIYKSINAVLGKYGLTHNFVLMDLSSKITQHTAISIFTTNNSEIIKSETHTICLI